MITFVPLYKWNSFNQAQFDSFCSIATKVFEDQINHYEYAENRMCIEENLSDELYNLRAFTTGSIFSLRLDKFTVPNIKPIWKILSMI